MFQEVVDRRQVECWESGPGCGKGVCVCRYTFLTVPKILRDQKG